MGIQHNPDMLATKGEHDNGRQDRSYGSVSVRAHFLSCNPALNKNLAVHDNIKGDLNFHGCLGFR
jgi:hypothetical protein